MVNNVESMVWDGKGNHGNTFWGPPCVKDNDKTHWMYREDS